MSLSDFNYLLQQVYRIAKWSAWGWSIEKYIKYITSSFKQYQFSLVETYFRTLQLIVWREWADCWKVNICSFNDNNNYKTSIATISSKWIELSGSPSTGLWQTLSLDTMQSSSTMIRWKENLGRISESEKVNFQMDAERNYAIWWLNMLRE